MGETPVGNGLGNSYSPAGGAGAAAPEESARARVLRGPGAGGGAAFPAHLCACPEPPSLPVTGSRQRGLGRRRRPCLRRNRAGGKHPRAIPSTSRAPRSAPPSAPLGEGHAPSPSYRETWRTRPRVARRKRKSAGCRILTGVAPSPWRSGVLWSRAAVSWAGGGFPACFAGSARAEETRAGR